MPSHVPDGLSDAIALLSSLVEAYSEERRTFSAWQNHCLGLAITLFRFGNHDQARRWVFDALRPPDPLPTFPLPRTLTLADARQVLVDLRRPSLVSPSPVTGSEASDRGPTGG